MTTIMEDISGWFQKMVLMVTIVEDWFAQTWEEPSQLYQLSRAWVESQHVKLTLKILRICIYKKADIDTWQDTVVEI